MDKVFNLACSSVSSFFLVLRFCLLSLLSVFLSIQTILERNQLISQDEASQFSPREFAWSWCLRKCVQYPRAHRTETRDEQVAAECYHGESVRTVFSILAWAEGP